MTRHLDVEQVLRSWLAEGAERAPERQVASALARIETTSQRQDGGFWPWHSMMSASPVNPLALATAFVAAVIGLALYFGTSPVGEREPTPSAVPDQASATPSASAPPESGTFRSTTSLGTIEWTRVVSPQPIYPTKGPDGQILGTELEGGTAWILSEDFVWEPAPPPELSEAATFVGPGEEWAVVSPDGFGVMMGPASSRQVISREYDEGGDAAIYQRSGSEWIEIPVPSTAPELPAGLQAFGPRFQGAAALDTESLVVPVIYHVEVPWGDVFGQYPGIGSGDGLVDPWPIWDENLQQLRIVEPGANGNPFAGPALATLQVDFAPDDQSVIEFRDVTTGELVHSVSGEMRGWSPDALLAGLQGWGFEAVSLVVYRDGEMTVVEPPWPMGEEWSDATPVVTGVGRYYTTSLPLGDDYQATGIHLWESPDGLAWTPIDLPAAATADVEWVELGGRADRMLMSVHGASGADSVWTTADGRAWAEADVGAASLATPVATDFGWLLAGAGAISIDGETWEPLGLPLLPGEPSLQYIGGLFLYGPGLDGGDHVTWIGRLVP